MALFSQRNKYKEPPQLDPEEMTQEVRNRIWNAIKFFFSIHPERNVMIPKMWDEFFKKDLDFLTWKNTSLGRQYKVERIKELFSGLEWLEIYDLIEYMLDRFENTDKNSSEPDKAKFAYAYFAVKVDKIFREEGLPYKILNKKIISLITKEEATEVENVFEVQDEFSEVKQHIEKALELFAKRPEPDYENSIKESISAVESLARIVTGEKNETLGQLTDLLDIHPALRYALNKLYGWTSDESGVRHAFKGGRLSSGQEEARYMLVTCSAFVNYIIAKQ